MEGLTRPTQAIWAPPPDGRMFVAEQDGVLKAVNPDGSTKVMLDIRTRVNSAGDRGLLGIAADSQIATNGFLYLAYTAETQPLTPDGNGAMTAQISRLTIDADSDVIAETIILGTRAPADGPCPAPSNTVDCLPSDADTHTIGSIHSMPDGTLFLGLGDGGDFNTVNDDVRRAQNELSHAGKIMHIDRDGLGLSGHAFCPADSTLTHVCTKLHAKGFRNPFRFKPNGSGGFNLGDVGQGSREEIDVVTSAGKNYGWPCYEANLQYDGYESDQLCQDLYAAEGTAQGATPPDYEYFHDDVGGDAASLGGPTYLATEYPAATYNGRIFFGDYAAGFIKVLEPTGPGGALVAQPFATDWFGVDLVSAPNGDIAYASFGTGANGTGSIQRIVYSPSNAQPVADAQATPQSSANVPETVDFDGSGSTDADGDDLSYEWDFDNGGSTTDSTAEQPTFTFNQAGTYDVKLTVDDGRGESDTDMVRVDVGNTPPVPNITGPAEYTSGDTVTLEASATDAQDGTITDFSWRSVLIHGLPPNGHEHGGVNDVPGASFDLDTPTTHGADSYYEVTVTATDSGGLEGTKTVRLDPRTTQLTIQSTPGGGDVTLTYYRNEPFPTPYQAFEAIGFETTVIARESFTAGGRDYEFASWSDGPTTRLRDVTIPGTPLTLVAQYTDVTPNAPPVANASAAPQSSPNVPQTVSFDGSGSTDPDPGDVLSYEWDFDNGGSTTDSTAEQPSFTFTQAGTYDVKLTVDDGRGETDVETIRVDVGTDPPVPPARPTTPGKPKTPAPDKSGPTFGFDTRKGVFARRSRLRGVVADPSGVKRMRVAVGRKYRNGRCAWWSTKRKRLSAPTRRCDRPAWITATLARRGNGAYDWGARLRRRLPTGDYRIALWAEDLRGNVAQRVSNPPRLRKR